VVEKADETDCCCRDRVGIYPGERLVSRDCGVSEPGRGVGFQISQMTD
jgi:hypothetical protein